MRAVLLHIYIFLSGGVNAFHPVLDLNQQDLYPSFIYHSYGEWQEDVRLLLTKLIPKSGIYLEMFEAVTYHSSWMKNNSFVVSVEEPNTLLDEGANDGLLRATGYLYHQSYAPNANTVDGFFDVISPHLKNLCPDVIKISNANGIIFDNSQILSRRCSIFFLLNIYESNSKDMIDMLLSQGPLHALCVQYFVL
jgi:hypothetical protein